MEALSCARSAFVIWVWVHQGDLFPYCPPTPSLEDKHGGWKPMPLEVEDLGCLSGPHQGVPDKIVEGLGPGVRQGSDL